MSKLLVNAPNGAQEIVTVGTGGGYFDPAYVLWDERADGPMPEGIHLGGMVRVDGALQVDVGLLASSQATALQGAVAAAVRRIDADVDAITVGVIGGRADEYTRAEVDAKAYAAAGYTGTVPPYVADYAAVMQTTHGWTAQQAADDILATAAAWRGAQDAMRAQRLGAKAAVRSAADVVGVDAVMAAWAGFLGMLRGQLGVGG